jgi:di/tricarboxylate transporter
MLMAALRLISSSEMLAGFSNPALITIMALMVMAQGLFQSGAFEKLSTKPRAAPLAAPCWRWFIGLDWRR